MTIVGRINQYASLNVSDQVSEVGYSTVSIGESSFTSPGTYSWTVPTNVDTISVVTVGGGGGGGGAGGSAGKGGGGGGALAYVNSISVTPGETLTVGVGTSGRPGIVPTSTASAGGNSYVKRGAISLVEAGGGKKGNDTILDGNNNGGAGGTVIVGSGGRGGNGGLGAAGGGGGGGGAGGYSGNGGNGNTFGGAGDNGIGGAGGGGGGGNTTASGGGGVGILGEGASGAGGLSESPGNGGSGGENGSNNGSAGSILVGGGKYGGGGGGGADSSGRYGNVGGVGAVRIIWGLGAHRQFPATRTGVLIITEPYAKPSISGLGTYTAIEFRENIGVSTLTLNKYSAYDPVYDEFAGVLYGPGKGTYTKQNLNGSIDVYNEINELDLTPTIVFTPSATSLNEGGIINFSIATTNVEDGIPLYYEIITPSPTITLTQSVSLIRYGNSVSFDATTVNVGNGTTLSYDIVGTVLSSDFIDNTLTGITTVTGGIIDTITKTTTAGGLTNKTFTLNLRSQGNIVATSSSVNIKPGLYDFTTATFTPGGSTGQNGPSLPQAISGLTGAEVDSWKNNTQYFNISTGIQLWTVPVTGTYTIEAFGAQGGSSGSRIGGKGVRMSGNFALTQGEIIRILVGQQGQTGGHSQNTSQFVSAGGGGTFVVRTPYNTTGSILVIEGGGGGSAENSWTVSDGRGGLTTTDGNSGQGGVSGGTAGAGGGGGDSSGSGPGGAGFSGNGLVDTLYGNVSGENSKSFINGAAGGRNSRGWSGPEIYGGFGGGGGGGGLSAGGGGGYSGGGGGSWSSQQAGGGGGSYNSGTSQSNQVDSRTGNGQVTITLVG